MNISSSLTSFRTLINGYRPVSGQICPGVIIENTIVMRRKRLPAEGCFIATVEAKGTVNIYEVLKSFASGLDRVNIFIYFWFDWLILSRILTSFICELSNYWLSICDRLTQPNFLVENEKKKKIVIMFI